MKVVGYDDQKNLCAANLPVEEIVRLGIDPFRVDLFDADPVVNSARVVGAGRRRLNFTRLMPLTFAYHGKQGERETTRGVIGTFDGERASCFTGKDVSERWEFSLDAQTIAAEGFAEHFVEFLRRSNKRNRCNRDWNRLIAAGLNPVQRTCAVNALNGNVSFPCSYHYSWQVKGQALPVYEYAGKMLHDVSFGFPLPPAVSRVFKLFEGMNPVVFGEALALAFHGKPVRSVSFFVDLKPFKDRYPGDNGPIAALKTKLEKFGHFAWPDRVRPFVPEMRAHSKCSFLLDDVLYNVLFHWSDQEDAAAHFGKQIGFSALQLFSKNENQIVANRIAAYDLARKRLRWTRKVHDEQDIYTWLSDRVPAGIRQAGFKRQSVQLPELWHKRSRDIDFWLPGAKRALGF